MIYLLIPLFIGIDLFTKQLALNYLQEYHNIFWNILFLKYVENTGIAFSFPIEWLLLKIGTIAIILFLTYYYLTEERPKNNLCIDLIFILIISGALGNAYERIVHEKVIDFIGIAYFSVFNLADVFITLWVIFYILHSLKHPQK